MAVAATLSLGLAACGSDDGETSDDGTPEADAGDGAAADDAVSQSDGDSSAAEVPTIVVTTNVLGDVVSSVVGDAADVVTIMPVGADPHDFQASAQEVDSMMNADALIVNGAAVEEGLLDVIESAEDEGVPTFEAISAVDTIDFGEGGHDHDEHSDEEHSDEEHSDEEKDEEGHDDHDEDDHDEEGHDDHDEEGRDDHDEEGHDDHDEEGHDDHDHSGEDPHFFTDPMRMAASVAGVVDFLQAQIEFADPAALDASADAYIAQLTALDGEVEELLTAIPDERRVLVTNHEVFGYFADRYEFEIVGAVIPSGNTSDSVSPGELAELAEVIEIEGVPAIFSDATSSDQFVETLAEEVGDISIVELFTESLGDADSEGATYLDMVRTNAERMSAALA
ncbi:MAG: metal ABC transporter solute-binding protein, Zn/Mn family [Ilumatobacter sp.]